MFFAYCVFLKQILSKIKHFFKLNQLDFNELNVIEQLNCILSSNFTFFLYSTTDEIWLYIRYIYILITVYIMEYRSVSIFILFLNHSLFCGLSFSLQQLVGMAMGWEYIPYQVSSRYPRC